MPFACLFFSSLCVLSVCLLATCLCCILCLCFSLSELSFFNIPLSQRARLKPWLVSKSPTWGVITISYQLPFPYQNLEAVWSDPSSFLAVWKLSLAWKGRTSLWLEGPKGSGWCWQQASFSKVVRDPVALLFDVSGRFFVLAWILSKDISFFLLTLLLVLRL